METPKLILIQLEQDTIVLVIPKVIRLLGPLWPVSWGLAVALAQIWNSLVCARVRDPVLAGAGAGETQARRAPAPRAASQDLHGGSQSPAFLSGA